MLTLPAETAPVVKHESPVDEHRKVVEPEREKLANSDGVMTKMAAPWVVVKEPVNTAKLAELS